MIGLVSLRKFVLSYHARPEVRLLRLVARSALAPGQRRRLGRLAASGLSWNLVLREAERHGLLALLHRHLRLLAAEVVPATVAEELAGRQAANRGRARFLAATTLETIAALEAAGIPAVPLRGQLLARRLYGDVAARPAGDIDLLLHRADVPAAAGVLEARGYRPALKLSEAERRRLLESWYVLALEAPGLRSVELHWDFVPAYFSLDIDAKAFWDRLEEAELGGRSFRCLGPEDLLLSLAVHGFKDLWERLIWVADVAELVRARPGLDWEVVIERTSRAGALRVLHLALLLASEQLQAPVPERVLRGADAAALRLRERVLRGSQAGVMPGAFAFGAFHLAGRERRADRARYLARGIFTPTPKDWSWVAMPDALLPLAAVVRPLRLALRALRSV